MDYPQLPRELKEAGLEYHKNLQALGLRASSLFWVYDHHEERFCLWLVWAGLDKYGPLAVQRLLFEAYRASALPQTIDPFVVQLHSPKAQLPRKLVEDFVRHKSTDVTQIGQREGDVGEVEPTFTVSRHWVYELGKKYNSASVSRHWKRFQDSVEHLAA